MDSSDEGVFNALESRADKIYVGASDHAAKISAGAKNGGVHDEEFVVTTSKLVYPLFNEFDEIEDEEDERLWLANEAHL